MPTSPRSARKPAIDPAAAESAFAALQRELARIPRAAVLSPNLDLAAAALAALAIAAENGRPAARARFASLPPREFSIASLDGLAEAARAAWYAQQRFASASAATRDARLPLDLAQGAAEQRARMLRVVTYHLEDHPTVGREIASIRGGGGYADLAADLARLARIYRDHRAVLRRDARHWSPTEASSAAGTAQRILDELAAGQNAEAKKWGELRARAFTHLSRLAGEVRAAGLFLWRHEEGEKRFPSLAGASKATSPPRKRPAAAGAPA